MIRIRYTMDSKRAGHVDHAPTLAAAKRLVRCKNPKFTPEELYGYPRAWEVTCGDTVVADAMELPDGVGLDYFPTYSMTTDS